MARLWTRAEEKSKRKELQELYVKDNRTIAEIATILKLGESTVYDRLVRLGIPSLRVRKPHYNNIRQDVVIPKEYSKELAEFVGVLLGDGHLNPTQVTVTLGKKDEYVHHVVGLMYRLFDIRARISFSRDRDKTIYFGSTKVVRWFLKMGLAFNKVKAQVTVPSWVGSKKNFMSAALRGLFDTDGSVYRLRYGVQLSFCNHSRPLLKSIRAMLLGLGYHPSRVSGFNIYVTRRDDIKRFFREVIPRNGKHIKRYSDFMNGCVA